jgi:CheY-like chemotaxis protein
MKKRILIVDDDATATRVLKLALEKQGDYEVREEHKGARALAAAEEFQPDAMLLDVCMPDKDGGDVAFEFKGDRRFKRLPIIFFTSLVSEQDDDTASPVITNGFRFLPKTVEITTLVKCLEEEIRTAQPRPTP